MLGDAAVSRIGSGDFRVCSSHCTRHNWRVQVGGVATRPGRCMLLPDLERQQVYDVNATGAAARCLRRHLTFARATRRRRDRGAEIIVCGQRRPAGSDRQSNESANGPFVNRVLPSEHGDVWKAIGSTVANTRWRILRTSTRTYYDEIGWNSFSERQTSKFDNEHSSEKSGRTGTRYSYGSSMQKIECRSTATARSCRGRGKVRAERSARRYDSQSCPHESRTSCGVVGAAIELPLRRRECGVRRRASRVPPREHRLPRVHRADDAERQDSRTRRIRTFLLEDKHFQ